MAAILAGMARYQHCGALVLLLSDAGAHWSLRVDPVTLGKNRRATAHWENLQNLRYEGCDPKLEDSLFVQEERLTTCAGMCSAADALLDLDSCADPRRAVVFGDARNGKPLPHGRILIKRVWGVWCCHFRACLATDQQAQVLHLAPA
jgi:hypothetical protein